MSSLLSKPYTRWSAIALLGGALSYPLAALERVELRLESLTGAGWRAQGITIDTGLGEDATLAFALTIDRLDLDGVDKPLNDIRFDCPEGRFSSTELSCDDARLRFPHPLLQSPDMRASLHWGRAADTLELQLGKLRYAGGTLVANITIDRDRWQAALRGTGVDLARVYAHAGQWLPDLPALGLKGKANLSASLDGRDQTPGRLKWQIESQKTGFAYADDSYLGDALRVEWSGEAASKGSRWQGSSTLKLSDGEVLTPRFYLGLAKQPLSLDSRFSLDPRRGVAQISEARVRQGKVIDLHLDAEATLQPFALTAIKANTAHLSLKALYDDYLQPVLAETLMENLEVAGQVSGDLRWSADGPVTLDAGLSEVTFREKEDPSGYVPVKRFGIVGLSGRLRMGGSAAGAPSQLKWQSAHLLEKVRIGAGQLDIRLDPHGFELLEGSRIPVMDGELMLHKWGLDTRKGKSGQWTFEGALTPISMKELSAALGWPELAGKLSGVIPRISYADDTLSVDGVLLVRIFDGQVRIRNLQLSELMGVLPVLKAEVDFDGIDLETLTGTFSFGKITGRLGGYVKGLALEGWKPVAFDARLATPEGDKSPRRISQRAVDNISNLGGAGVSGALSRSFLGIFEEFNYDRLGITCQLQGSTCNMGGIAPADGGYFLVIGRGVPQINIKGYTTRTDWNRLVDQLVQITQSEGPVVQ